VFVFPCLPKDGDLSSVAASVFSGLRLKDPVFDYDGVVASYSVDVVGFPLDGECVDAYYYYKSSSGVVYRICSEVLNMNGSSTLSLKGFAFFLNSNNDTYYCDKMYNDYVLGKFGLILVELKHHKKFCINLTQKIRYYVSFDKRELVYPIDEITGKNNRLQAFERLRYTCNFIYVFALVGIRDGLVGSVGDERFKWIKHERWSWFLKQHEAFIKHGIMVNSLGHGFGIRKKIIDYSCTFCSQVRGTSDFGSIDLKCRCGPDLNIIKVLTSVYELLLRTGYPCSVYHCIEEYSGNLLYDLDELIDYGDCNGNIDTRYSILPQWMKREDFRAQSCLYKLVEFMTSDDGIYLDNTGYGIILNDANVDRGWLFT